MGAFLVDKNICKNKKMLMVGGDSNSTNVPDIQTVLAFLQATSISSAYPISGLSTKQAKFWNVDKFQALNLYLHDRDADRIRTCLMPTFQRESRFRFHFFS